MEPLLDPDYEDDVFGQGFGTPDSPLQLPTIGSRVVVGVHRSDLVGTVHFLGPTLFAEGDWIGIELDTPSGKNDGAVGSMRYFHCQPSHGIFARPRMVRLLSTADARAYSTPPVQQTTQGKMKNGRSRGAAATPEDQSATIQADAVRPASSPAGDVAQNAGNAKLPRKPGRRGSSSEKLRALSRAVRQGDLADVNAEDLAEAISLAIAYQKENQKLRPMELELAKARESIAALRVDNSNCLERISGLVAENEECKRLREAFSEQELELKAFRAAAVALQSEMEVCKRELAASQANVERLRERNGSQTSVESYGERASRVRGADETQQRELGILRESFGSLQQLAQKSDAQGIKDIVRLLENQLTSQEKEIVELRKVVESLSTAIAGMFGKSDANSTKIRLQIEELQKRFTAGSGQEQVARLEEQVRKLQGQKAELEDQLDLTSSKSRASYRPSVRSSMLAPTPKLRDLRKSLAQLKIKSPLCSCGKPGELCTCRFRLTSDASDSEKATERMLEMEQALEAMEKAMERMIDKEMQAVEECGKILESEDIDEQAQDWLIDTFRQESEGKPSKTKTRTTVHLGAGVHKRLFESDRTDILSEELQLASGLLQTARDRLIKMGRADEAKNLVELGKGVWVEELRLIDSWSDFDIFRFADRIKHNYVAIMGHAVFVKHDIIDTFKLNSYKMKMFLLSVEEKYNDNPYHSSLHAADATQTLNMFLADLPLNPLEVCTSIMAAACHDIGHPGVTNDFRVKRADEDALTFSDKSVNENMHCALTFRTLRSDDHNFLETLPEPDYAQLRKWVVNIILGTDMIQHFGQVQQFNEKIAQEGGDVSEWEDRQLLMEYLVHSADLSNVTKPRPVALKWTHRVLEEFFAQGDLERKLGQALSPLCDRETVSTSSSQIGFIQFIVKPLFEGLNSVQGLTDAQRALDYMSDYQEYWKGVREKEDKEKEEKDKLEKLSSVRQDMHKVPSIGVTPPPEDSQKGAEVKLSRVRSM